MHGGDIYLNRINIDFSVNINPLGMPAEISDAALAAVQKANNYPQIDSLDLRKKAAKFYGLKPEMIIAGNGAAELLYVLLQQVASQKKTRAAIFSPSFSEYEKAAIAAGLKCDFFENIAEIPLDIQTGAVIICNPNNPTGQIFSEKQLLKLAADCEKNEALLVIDESFMDFTDGAENLLENKNNLKNSEQSEMPCEIFDNLVIVKSMTKFFAMPGIRLGFAFCRDVKLIERLYARMQPWSVSLIAQHCGLKAFDLLENSDFRERTYAVLRREKEFLAEGLTQLGMEVSNEKGANFLIFKFAKKADTNIDLYSALLKKNILIRDCSDFALLKGWYRVCVRNHEDNMELLATIRGVLEEPYPNR